MEIRVFRWSVIVRVELANDDPIHWSLRSRRRLARDIHGGSKISRIKGFRELCDMRGYPLHWRSLSYSKELIEVLFSDNGNGPIA